MIYSEPICAKLINGPMDGGYIYPIFGDGPIIIPVNPIDQLNGLFTSNGFIRYIIKTKDGKSIITGSCSIIDNDKTLNITCIEYLFSGYIVKRGIEGSQLPTIK